MNRFMKKFFVILISFFSITAVFAQENTSMNKTIRLIYPQWQGGIVSHWMPDIPADDSSRGYYLGAQLLNMLAPETDSEIFEVPVSLNPERKAQDGVMDKVALKTQTRAALDILEKANPDKIVTLGGECAVSVVPFTYLAKKYDNDVAIIWIDAHPDINLPGDEYQGYHAMALTAAMGMGDSDIINMLPAKFDTSKALIVGLRSWDKGMKERQKELGIKGLSPEELSKDSSAVLDWLKNTGVKKVVIHFDLDVIDPDEMIAGVGVEPNGMKIDDVVRVINDINANYEIVGLTIAEPMPRIAIKLRNMMSKLPLLN